MKRQEADTIQKSLQSLQFDIIQQRFGIIGKSPLFLHALERAVKVAPTDLTVLLRGESGTGKEVFARLIHALSHRKDYPLVTVNCAAIPDTLLEAELFGYEKGAFTDAKERHRGFFEVANRGTIFLDEVAEMSPKVQAKLLRVLETGEFTRLGSTEILQVDVRIISATNRPLEQAVQAGEFRQDLYYRLNTVEIVLPALRDRKEDIPLLAEFFAHRTAERLAIEFEGITEEATEILSRLPWHGNIRELRNLIETIITIEKPQRLTASILQKYLPRVLSAPQSDQSAPGQPEAILKDLAPLEQIQKELSEIKDLLKQLLQSFRRSLPEPKNESHLPTVNLGELEKRAIIQALQMAKGNKKRAAEILGISRKTLYRKLVEYRIDF